MTAPTIHPRPRRAVRPKHKTMTEKQYQDKITDLCDYLHLKWHHETDSRRSKKGFPDLLIAGVGGVLFVELKSDLGKVTKEQREWMDRLAEAGAEVHLWYPDDWEEAKTRLFHLAGKVAPSEGVRDGRLRA